MKKAVWTIVCLLLLTACGGSTESAPAQDSDITAMSTAEGTGQETGQAKENEGNGGEAMTSGYDFSAFTNVEITGTDIATLSTEEQSVLYAQAKYCQAMTEADADTLRELVPEDAVFTHMSGRQQTREEYFADIESDALDYYTIGIEGPVIEVNGDAATITCTSVLNANAYGARGTYRMGGTRHFEKVNGNWIIK
ncbi:MAG: nuclear transport factor 2 family protein [Lachnospiraceae bacterium]|nr:nuclear transport factor 2 family protein [Lachnospiraceae bacterium]